MNPGHAGHAGHASLLGPAGHALRAPWQWWRNAGGPWRVWLLPAALLLVLGALSAAAFGWMPQRLAWIVLALSAALALCVLWAHQFLALLTLDHPHAARLVPGHALALRRTALLLWGAMVAVCGVAAAAAVYGLGGDGAASLRALLLAALGAGAVLLFVALALRWWGLWLWIWLVPLADALPGLRPATRALTGLLREQWGASPGWVTALALISMGVVLVSIFGAGDARHARSYAARERLRRAFEASSGGQQPTLVAFFGRWGEWLGRPWQRLADAWLARLIARASARPASVLARAEVALHGSQHVVRQLTVMLPLLLTGLAVLAVVFAATSIDAASILQRAGFGIGIGLVSMLLSVVMGPAGALWASRREQALLMLLPGMPQGAVLNRALAWRQTRNYLLAWVLVCGAFAAMVGAGLTPAVLALPAVALPMVAWSWRDVSRQRAPTQAGAAAPFLLCLALGAASVALLREQPAAWLPWLLAWALLSALALGWRWRRLSRLPQALPAGRLA